jgi:hypothetical protein
VLVPEAYYEASLLKRYVRTPCTIGYTGVCRHYRYPSLSSTYPSVNGRNSFTVHNGIRKPSKEQYRNNFVSRFPGFYWICDKRVF